MHSGFWQDPLPENLASLDQAWHLDEGRNSSWWTFTEQDVTHSAVGVRRDLRRLRDWPHAPLNCHHSSFHFPPCLRFGANHADGRRNPSGFPPTRLRLDL